MTKVFAVGLLQAVANNSTTSECENIMSAILALTSQELDTYVPNWKKSRSICDAMVEVYHINQVYRGGANWLYQLQRNITEGISTISEALELVGSAKQRFFDEDGVSLHMESESAHLVNDVLYSIEHKLVLALQKAEGYFEPCTCEFCLAKVGSVARLYAFNDDLSQIVHTSGISSYRNRVRAESLKIRAADPSDYGFYLSELYIDNKTSVYAPDTSK